jgi:hypothetical protein
MNDFRDEIRSAARDVCRVLKHINGEGVKQMVVNEETVSPLRCKPPSPSFSVVTRTTSRSIDHNQDYTRLRDPSHQQTHLLGNRHSSIMVKV